MNDVSKADQLTNYAKSVAQITARMLAREAAAKKAKTVGYLNAL